jgi:prepilin-type N-terminal cleavage/methylation domain-containing protein
MNTESSKLERGFTLIEVLAAIVILSIVSLVFTSYFANALTYANNNQNKTVMVNLARNALFYVEKQDFEEMQKYFTINGAGEFPDISGEQCHPDATSPVGNCSDLFKNSSGLDDSLLMESVLNPTINGVVYNITISYQSELHDAMLHPADTTNVAEMRKMAMAEYLLPVRVTVSGSAGSGERTNETVVEGYITDDKIR